MAVPVPHRGAGERGQGYTTRAVRLHLQRDVRRRAARGRAVHRRRGQRLLLVPLAHPRRPHQPLRPHPRCASPTTTSSRARATVSGFDWPIGYDDLAPYYDKAERFIGVTGSDGGHPQRARRHLPAAGRAAGARRARAARVREARHPRDSGAPGGHHHADQRPRAVPLLRPVRPRLHDGVELRVELRPDLSGDEDRARRRSRQRDGARARHGRVGQGDAPSRTSTRRRARSSRCAAARWCSPRARASRRGCCSTRSRRGTRRGSRTPPAWSGAT